MRSIGLLAFSQCSAADRAIEHLIGEARVRRLAREVPRRRRRAPAATWCRCRASPSEAATLVRICQSSTAFARGVDRARSGLHQALVVRVGGVLLHPRCPGQNDIGDLRERGLQHALVDHDRQAAALAGLDDPLTDRPSSHPGRDPARRAPRRGPGRSAVRRRRQVGVAIAACWRPADRDPARHCTFGASIAGTRNLVSARLLLLGARHATCTCDAPPSPFISSASASGDTSLRATRAPRRACAPTPDPCGPRRSADRERASARPSRSRPAARRPWC